MVKNLAAVEKHAKLYPDQSDCDKIREFDKNNTALDIDLTEVRRAYDTMKQSLEEQGLGHFASPFEGFKADFDVSPAVKHKQSSFHYLPYDFKQSEFEEIILKKALELNDFKNQGLEIYYNGERGLTEFVITCFAKQGPYWKNIGKYTTDFLIVQRAPNNTLRKALLLETKGAGYSHDPVFQKKRAFIETDFIKLNQEKFDYPRFDFLYLEDSVDINANTVKLNNKINQFFNGTG
jgi:type III restriction enzyme